MLALAQSSAADDVHAVDLPYRFASWAFDAPDNIALWVDDAGELVAWAAMQTPFWAIDIVIRPHAESSALHQVILMWADARAKAIVNTRFGRPVWFVNVMSHQAERIHDLEALGFANQANVAENAWSKVLMIRAASIPLPSGERLGEGGSKSMAILPDGFTIRPLAGEREVNAYVALHRAAFESDSMTIEWRRRVLVQPAYTPELDLVLAAPDGSLAGFCVCWLDGAHGQIEPMGIRADMRGKGLGKMLLTEGLRRLAASGATHAFVETDNFRDAAFALYESVGFRVQHQVFVFRKDYT